MSCRVSPMNGPYDAIVPAVVPFGDPGAPVNGPNAPLAELSAHMDFSKPDAAPETALSAAVWKSVRGTDSKMPAPRHSLLLPPRPSGARPGEGGSPHATAEEDDD